MQYASIKINYIGQFTPTPHSYNMYNLHEGNSPIEQSDNPIEQSGIDFLYMMSLKLINNHKHVYLTALRVVVKYISQYFCKIIY